MSVYGRVAAHGVAATGQAEAADDDWETDPDYVVWSVSFFLFLPLLHHSYLLENYASINKSQYQYKRFPFVAT